MKIKLNITDINNRDDDYFSDMIHNVLDLMIENKLNLDSVKLIYFDGTEEEVR